ncbi:hypothetical protein W97_04293 [Coniosporium apollinis CBS 100218]|uniref:Xylanolytic transcriptional activator regulatory domain-containing protein n=1 Tax=Coniosporium apollinis (strain CBS 100218) TaxID=1168221 RepID=R7YT96_CONA1|nr:uncharacterized protein W97_04293 [Coniosporium apollinis CBS 100218]EON65058.1 hypothetical protein W97_04293 [Coniosporium apollinis CBS 100218]
MALQRSSEEEAAYVLQRLKTSDHYQLAQQIRDGQLLAEFRGDELSPPYSSSGYTPDTSSPRPPVSVRLAQYEELVRTLANATPLEVEEIIGRLRRENNVPSILSAVKTGSLSQPLSTRESDPSPGIEAEYAGGEQNFGLVKGPTAQSLEDQQHRVPDAHTPLNNQSWTTVTDDRDLIEYLLSLYFSWQHCFFQSFPEKLFREDMAAGRTKYCSRLLVNAICAAGCLLYNHTEPDHNSFDPRTAGSRFFDEAVKILNDTEQPSIPTTAALYLLCHVEGSRGRMSALWMLSGRSTRMALHLNLHLRSDRAMNESLTTDSEKTEKARRHAFWGCFISDQVASFTLGRIPQIPVNAITVDLPAIAVEEDESEWIAYGISRPRKPSLQSSTFHAVAELSKIVNSTLLMFFAPSKVMSGHLLLEEYRKYTQWYAKLPEALVSTEDATPHVLSMHMYYHAAVLLLFRPFLKAQFTESDVSPRDVCRSSANAISDIFAQHRHLYNLVGIYTFQLHCLLTACTIHIINLPAIASGKYLAAACNHMQDLTSRSKWATLNLSIIKGLVQKWNIILPIEAEQALYKNQDTLSEFDFGDASQADTFRPEKRPNYLNPSSQVMQKRQRLAPRETREQPTNYLFAPFPNQPAPLLGPIHTSTSADTVWNDELSKVAQGFDGLSFNADDWFDPFMGYQGD